MPDEKWNQIMLALVEIALAIEKLQKEQKRLMRQITAKKKRTI